MLKSPRRRGSENVSTAEQAASVLRHELRNKFASIVNATTYIERSLDKLELLERDPRIARFLSLIVGELEGADRLLDEHARQAKPRRTGKSHTREK